jgi:hypothetical protein
VAAAVELADSMAYPLGRPLRQDYMGLKTRRRLECPVAVKCASIRPARHPGGRVI